MVGRQPPKAGSSIAKGAGPGKVVGSHGRRTGALSVVPSLPEPFLRDRLLSQTYQEEDEPSTQTQDCPF